MSVHDLRRKLHEIPRALQRLAFTGKGGYADLSGPDDGSDEERGTEAAGGLVPEGYVSTQDASLEAIETAAARAAARCPMKPAPCLFVCGSVARLEYDPPHSDIDFLAVLPRPPAGAAGVRAARIFEKFERELTREVAGEVNRALRRLSEKAAKPGAEGTGSGTPQVSPKDVGIDSVPHYQVEWRAKPGKARGGKRGRGQAPVLRRAKRFFDHDDLFAHVGKEWEASWAVIERAHLVFEGAVVGPGHGAAALREKADEMYGVSEWKRESKREPVREQP